MDANSKTISLGTIRTFYLTLFKPTTNPAILKQGSNAPGYWVRLKPAQVDVYPYSEAILLNVLMTYVGKVVNQAQNGQTITMKKCSYSDAQDRVCLWALANVIDPRTGRTDAFKCHAEATLP